MYYGRKKGLIVLVILIVLIVLLLVGSFAFIFFTTDLFKSNDAMFFKYIGKSIEEMQFTENAQLSAIATLKESSPYTVKGTVGFEAEGTNINPTLNNLSRAKIEYNAKVDPIDEKAYAKADLKTNSNTIFSVEYANSNDLYAFKSNDIVTAFIGIENKNLDELKNKLGLPGINISNQVQTQSLTNGTKLTEQEKQHIIEYYSKVLKENIPSSAFTKESNIATKKDGMTYNTTGYRLNLTSTQIKNLEIALLKALKQDSITLNIIATKSKALGLGDDYTEINRLSMKIDEAILNIQNDAQDINDISIIVYVSNGEVITTELIEKNKAKYTLTCKKTETGSTRNLLVENLDIDATYDNVKINFVENSTSTKTFANLNVSIDDTKTFGIEANYEGSAAQGTVNSTFNISYSDENNNTYTLDIQQELEFVDEIENIIELNRSNCGVLNDYTTEQVQGLIKSISERISIVMQEKMELLGVNFSDNSNNVNPLISDVVKEQEIQTFNSKFEAYIGKISGTSLNTLSSVVKKNNENNENKKIILTVEGLNTAGDSKTIDSNKTYYVDVTYNSEGYINGIYASENSDTLNSYIQAAVDGVNTFKGDATRQQQTQNNEINSLSSQNTIL